MLLRELGGRSRRRRKRQNRRMFSGAFFFPTNGKATRTTRKEQRKGGNRKKSTSKRALEVIYNNIGEIRAVYLALPSGGAHEEDEALRREAALLVLVHRQNLRRKVTPAGANRLSSVAEVLASRGMRSVGRRQEERKAVRYLRASRASRYATSRAQPVCDPNRISNRVCSGICAGGRGVDISKFQLWRVLRAFENREE